MKRLIIPTFLAIGLIGFSSFKKENSKSKEGNKPTNIILLIGDGMGLSQMSSAFYYGEEEPNFKRFPIVGLSRTSSAKEKITDSAAGATAIACGKKSYNGAIGVDVDVENIENLVEYLSARDYQTALLSTSAITHATPASFYAHAKSRNMATKIAEQMPNSGVDFFAGGGRDHFLDKKVNPELMESLKKEGFVINLEKLIAADQLVKGKKYGFLLAKDGMPKMTKGRGDFLPDATQLAYSYLSLEDKPYFMMIEGSQIDWGGHANNAEYVIQETLDFDKVVGLVLDHAEKDGNTLVIVTADHETGGFTLAAKQKKIPFQGLRRDYKEIEPRFSTGGHSATMVPVLAYGPGSETFSGIYQNTEIHSKILALLETIGE